MSAPPPDLRGLLTTVTGRLAAAGVSTPRVDAELLLSHVLGVPRGRLLLADAPDAATRTELDRLVARREARAPLQHLLGTAVLGAVEVAVGPGVFIPRPETETLLSWALERLADLGTPLVVDLCTGSAALALAIAAARPDAVLHAVETDPDALVWATRNTIGTSVTLHAADVTDPDTLAAFAGCADLVVANPPYVPVGTPVPPEVDHDPARAVFGGADGLDVVRPLVALAVGLLRPGGAVGIEHDDTHADAVTGLLRDAGLTGVEDRPDLAGRPRVAYGHVSEKWGDNPTHHARARSA